VKWRPIVIVFAACAVVVGLGIWLQHARLAGHWFQVHTGIVNEPGPYYGFWSGFGSDLEEFGILGLITKQVTANDTPDPGVHNSQASADRRAD